MNQFTGILGKSEGHMGKDRNVIIWVPTKGGLQKGSEDEWEGGW